MERVASLRPIWRYSPALRLGAQSGSGTAFRQTKRASATRARDPPDRLVPVVERPLSEPRGGLALRRVEHGGRTTNGFRMSRKTAQRRTLVTKP